jgi:hypothetical protein
VSVKAEQSILILRARWRRKNKRGISNGPANKNR